MASDSSKALTKRSAATALMPPPPPPKRIKRPAKVLDEDTYTEALSHIIARDFFPGLLETQTQQEYLEAISSKDSQWIADAGRRLTEVMTPRPGGRRGRRGVSMTPSRSTQLAGETPRGWTGDTPRTPAHSDDGEAPAKKEKPVDLNMSLEAFQAKYTSEDNESFNALLDKQNVKKRAQNNYLWAGNKIPSARQIAWRAREAEEASDTTKLLESSSSTAFETQLVRTTHAPDSRPSSLDQRTGAPDNALMFPPSSIEDTHPTAHDAALKRSNIPPKRTIAANTRFEPTINPSPTIPASPSLSAIDAAIAGRPRPSESKPGYSGASTPRVNGYTFVDAEPPAPESTATASDAELLARLGPSDAVPNPFSIAHQSKREDLHHRLVDKHSKAARAGGGGAKGRLGALKDTPRFKSSPVQRGSLTPAARALLEKVGTPRRMGAFGSMGEKAWTPGAKVRR